MSGNGDSFDKHYEEVEGWSILGIYYKEVNTVANRIQIEIEQHPDYQAYREQRDLFQSLVLRTSEQAEEARAFVRKLHALERAAMQVAIDLIAKHTGKHPLGFDVPAGM